MSREITYNLPPSQRDDLLFLTGNNKVFTSDEISPEELQNVATFFGIKNPNRIKKVIIKKDVTILKVD